MLAQRWAVWSIEVFHTRDQNHVTAGCDSILGVKLCNSCSGSGIDMLSKLAANLVTTSLVDESIYGQKTPNPKKIDTKGFLMYFGSFVHA